MQSSLRTLQVYLNEKQFADIAKTYERILQEIVDDPHQLIADFTLTEK